MKYAKAHYHPVTAKQFLAEKHYAGGIEITPEVAAHVADYMEAFTRARDSLPKPSFWRRLDTAWGVPLATFAIWCWIACMFLKQYLSH